MTPHPTMLVPVDPRAPASPALPVAARLAEQLDLAIELFAVPSARGAAASERALAAMAAAADELGAPEARTNVVDDESAAGAVLRRSAHPDVELVCMATRSTHGPVHAVFGSVAESVFARAAVPVVVVGRGAPPPSGPYRRVVACLDGTAAAVRALRVAHAFRRALDAELVVVTVIHPGVALDPAVPPDGRLAAISELAVGTPDSAHVLRGVEPATTIADFLHAGPTDQLVVSGCREKPGPRAFVLGSFTRGLAAAAPCPLVVVPSGADLDRFFERRTATAG